MNIVCIGGGPAGLYAGLLLKKRNPQDRVVVIERNRPFDTFGWGVVFSDATLENLKKADLPTAEQIIRQFNHWDDIDIHIGQTTIRSGGHGFIGIGRKKMLNILQQRCLDLGVELVFETVVEDDQALAVDYDADLVIASDGINSRIRTRYADTFRPDIDTRRCRFVWLGTQKTFDAFTFAFVNTEHGWFQAHAYQYEEGMSTFIVETRDETWRAAGIDSMSQEDGIAYCEKLFAPWLDGHKLLSNAKHLRGSAIWIQFPRVICGQWVHKQTLPNGKTVPVVLMGDAAHTAHFSIGSGTKLALEDAIELAGSFQTCSDIDAALTHYEALRSVEVLKIQNAARNSTEWFENVKRYSKLAPEQFAYSLLTRSQRISHENLRLRDSQWMHHFERWFSVQGTPASQPDTVTAMAADSDIAAIPPMWTPFSLRSVVLKNRIVVSPMAMYSCTDGVPGDFHFQHLLARALGGAGLVMVEMTCVSPQARITPYCPGLWNQTQMQAWQHIVQAVHTQSDAKIGIQLGHAGRKGSTKAAWDGIDMPLESGNWPLVSASPLPYLPDVSQTPTALDPSGMQQITDEFVQATKRAAQAGFDVLELHCAHGYLLSCFISPLTNQRSDAYGGVLENRLRFPLEVFAAMRAVWPEDRPLNVRISASDWVEGGITPDDAVLIARAFKAAGADLIDCSSGQVSPDQKPVYGRMYQTPFADEIRNQEGIATMAVGAITEADQVNSIIASGRADLCAIGRPHLANPAWTLSETAKIGYTQVNWPRQYSAGKRQIETLFERAQSMQNG
ncbi:bifunctional salicylyl-CoA 5-hydroxylase/oxidoreductase [Advenella mimigardefordensis]|uniref:Putative 2-aminobenzoyl-CoA monooxygenase/reductase n=1 Tax=Advenella mimigardefordensis (strain DSM 17166 / LMG 22922 / DPN7) TaxID=1247726 RepID=W0PJX3_ADVMD|nr:bifunctional salicylyl-CoA 5-hydroxylase/oxidoreductase [Advenella mimigardefordensis]AHG65283.1 putative 2-aminobenzoyl-CoA monooxygenase/reductase [Advenella mimigardefordensis DPN7]